MVQKKKTTIKKLSNRRNKTEKKRFTTYRLAKAVRTRRIMQVKQTVENFILQHQETYNAGAAKARWK